MTNLAQLPPDVLYHRISGGACIKLRLSPDDDHQMLPVLVFTMATGRTVAVEICAEDIVPIYEDLKAAFAADATKVTRWWRQLTGAKHSTEGLHR